MSEQGEWRVSLAYQLCGVLKGEHEPVSEEMATILNSYEAELAVLRSEVQVWKDAASFEANLADERGIEAQDLRSEVQRYRDALYVSFLQTHRAHAVWANDHYLSFDECTLPVCVENRGVLSALNPQAQEKE